jgi:homoserine kinase type II
VAVYTRISQEALREHLERCYLLGRLEQAAGITEGVENSNFLLRIADGQQRLIPYIFTIFEKRVKPEELPYYLGIMEYLNLRGFPSPLPVRGKNGNCLYTVMGKASSIVSFLPGSSTRKIQNHHLRLLGEGLARMHMAGQGYEGFRANDLSLAGWQGLFGKIRHGLDTIRPGLEQELEQELAFLSEHWPEHLPSGVIHADAFPDNVFFNAKGTELTGIIDFYFACNDAYIYELAIALNAWCFEHWREFNITRARQLFRGYGSVRELSPAELDALPVLCRGAALRFLLTRAHDWLNPAADAIVMPKDPLEYWQKLRFHRAVRQWTEYGL